jgi:hypothetical protein
MLATLVDEPFDDKRWLFETKWDGFRLITEKRGHTVLLWSRNGIDVTTKYGVLLPALQRLRTRARSPQQIESKSDRDKDLCTISTRPGDKCCQAMKKMNRRSE